MGKKLRLREFFEFRQTFLLTAFLLIALGNIEQFFILFFCVTVHELTHVLIALSFGRKTSRIIFTALGETAVIKNLDTLELYKKIIILVGGPVSNILLALLFRSAVGGSNFFITVNLSLAAFNMLPLYPLDGGRILRYILSEIIGVIKSHKLMSRLCALICWLFMIAGLLQVVLYPFNISLVCIGLYMKRLNRRQYLPDIFEFYKVKLNVSQEGQKIRNVKHIVVHADLPVSILVERLSWNRFYYFYIIERKMLIYEFNELYLMEYISAYGMSQTIGEICRAMQIKQIPVYCIQRDDTNDDK